MPATPAEGDTELGTAAAATAAGESRPSSAAAAPAETPAERGAQEDGSAESAPAAQSRPASAAGPAASAGDDAEAAPVPAGGSRPASAAAQAEPAGGDAAADPVPAVGSRPASAAAAAAPAETGGSRPGSAAGPVVAAGSRPASATNPAAAGGDAVPATSGGSRPASASSPAAAVDGDAAPARASGSRPASASSPAAAADGDAVPATASGSRPASASPVPPVAVGDRPSSAALPAASPRVPTSARGGKHRVHEALYDPAQFIQPIDPAVQLPLSCAPTVALLSLDAQRRNNMHYIEDDVLVMAAGNRVVFLKLPTMTQTYLPGLDGGSVGAVAVHPSRKYLAVAEKCRHRAPNVYVYSYPALGLVKVMQGGTEHAYSAVAFNDTGDQLASVGGWPDYLITLWRWEEEAIVLRSKAFSQDVYTVKFSPYFSGNILTSGTGHIRFWKMASTFTGLKLQGQIGKFGNVELTDIAAFVELPDGKVLSGTETGELLLWDGGLIKVVLTRSNRKPCHEGQIHVLMHDRGSNTILSGGSDGYVRLWDFNKINDAEPDEDSNSMSLAPVNEMLISPGGTVRGLLWERRHWLVLDGTGALIKVDLPQAGLPSKGSSSTRLLDFHAAGIVGAITSPTAHIAMTASRDGTVRVYDYVARQQLGDAALFSQPATCMARVGASATMAVVGFQDGIVRAVMRLDGGLRLISALKPHKGAVTMISVSHDHKCMVTGGKDATVFFFSVALPKALEPMCYMKLPAPCLCASWSVDGSTVLLGLDNGMVVEVAAPEPGSVDTTKTFETVLPTREFMFHLPKPRKIIKRKKSIVPEEATDAAGDSAPAPDTPDAAPAEAGTEGAAAAGAEGEKPPEEEEEVEEEVVVEDDEYQEKEVFQILTISYVPSSQPTSLFHLTLTGGAAGSVWQCDLDTADDPAVEPVKAYPAPACAPASVYGHSQDGRLQLMGTTDGMVRVQPVSPPHGAPSGPYWQAPLHDMQTGRVSAVALSFDNAYLLTTAQDGTMCLQELHLEGHSPAQPQPSGQEVLVALADAPTAATDITNPNEYTLEEAKQKAEQDALEAAAEAKKMGVREYLQQIRSEFEALLAENDAKPEAERLPRSAFEIDVDLREMVAQETARREEAARKELAWETEKRRLTLAKLKKFFLDNVEVEHIVLHAIRGKQFISTFRTARMSEELLLELEAAKQAEADAAVSLAQRKALAGAAEASALTAGGVAGTGAAAGAAAAAAAMAPPPGLDTSRMSKADLRRMARKQREAAWTAFNTTRPNEKYEDPADVAAIEEAERNMGDFKLKSDPNYIVPEEERMTPQRKRYQMLLLEETMHAARMDFNRRFLALREVKKKVVSEINSRVSRLRDIQAQLGKTAATGTAGEEDEPLMQPLSLRPEEMPEDREKVTDADIEEFLKRKEEDERKASEGSALGGFAGGGGGGGNKAAGAPPAPAPSAAGTGRPPVGAVSSRGPGGKGGASGAPSPEVPAGNPAGPQGGDDALSRIMAAVPLTDLERQLQGYHRRRLLQQKARLREELDEMSDAFDSALDLLRRDKFRLEKDIKQCEIRQLVQAQELSLLFDFDKREVVLIQKRAAKHDDRNDILDKISECSGKLEVKRSELEGLMARRAAVAAEFDSAVPESDPFREALSKIFYRRLKRSKKKTGAVSGTGEAETEDDEDDEEDEEEGDDDDDDDGGEEVCPPGCDQGLYEKVCDLREHRLDEEELVADFTRAIDSLRKDRESLAKKQKLVEQGLGAVNAEIAAFQQEKQAALNQIDVVVNLHMHQIEYLADGRLPDDLSAALVFSSTQLGRLRRRIDELEDEKSDLRLRHKGLKKEHLQLLKDKSDKEARVAELEARAHDVQMLKFGQEVDMELLDALDASRGSEELRAELAAQEAAHARELAEWDAKIAARTDELMALTHENTGALNAVSALTAAQRGLESGLTATRKTMFADPVTLRRQEVEERDGLVQLVNAQAKELERLRAQVSALKRKDTSVYQ